MKGEAMTQEQREIVIAKVKSLPNEQRLQLGKDTMFWSFGYFHESDSREVNAFFQRIEDRLEEMSDEH